ncbi:MAG: heme o synthase [Desulfurococcales archaeon]|nr:heme o synthase [Desulfurococcales archaeon]
MTHATESGYNIINIIITKLKAIIVMTKPLQLLLLSITMFGAYLASGAYPDLVTLLLLAITGLASIGGVTALNMILERDIDGLMRRTSNRPLVKGVLGVGEALASVTALMTIGLLAALQINEYVAFAVLGGLYFDIIMYTELAKRRTVLNILLGGVAGGMPALGGWAAGRGSMDLGGFLLAGIVMAWIPMHIWFISYYYKDDYIKAGIPMASVVLKPRQVAILVRISLLILNIFMWTFLVVEGYGITAAILTTILSFIANSKVVAWTSNPTRESARAIFKFASPIMASIFLALPIDFWALKGVLEVLVH